MCILKEQEMYMKTVQQRIQTVNHNVLCVTVGMCPVVAMAAARELCPDSASPDKGQGEDGHSSPSPSGRRNQVGFQYYSLFIHIL